MFFENDFTVALESDSDSWSVPLIKDADTPFEIWELFSDIVYSKVLFLFMAVAYSCRLAILVAYLI